MQKISFIIDNVLEVGAFKKYQEYLQNTSVYRTLEVDAKKSFVTDVPFGLQESIVSVLSSVHHKEIKILLSTIRKATKFLDKDWGIHADWDVGVGETPEYGAVYYISENNEELNGTALWRHKEHGYEMPNSFSREDKLDITNKSYHDIDDWELSSVIGGKENRLVTYPAEYFHSKFPKQAWGTTQKDSRLVFALFYSLIS